VTSLVPASPIGFPEDGKFIVIIIYRDNKSMESPSDALAAATRLHQFGQLAEAEALYRRVLERDPKHPGALHLLGVLAHQQGHDDRAAGLIALAMELRPLQATYHSNYGVALRGLGRLDEAADALRLPLRLWPEYPDAHSHSRWNARIATRRRPAA
jgi:Tfp pilus assembly protein PilF